MPRPRPRPIPTLDGTHAPNGIDPNDLRVALGREPERPAAYARLEELPQRFDVLRVDPAAVKAYIAARANA